MKGLAGSALAFAGRPAAAAPKAELWPRWQAHDPRSRATIDHGVWDAFLQRQVVAGGDGIHRLAYGRIGAEDRAMLTRYVDMLAAQEIDAHSRDEQRAFWINLYSALTLRVVLDHYPVASIRDIRISPGLFSPGPWGKKLVRVAGEALSLDDIEHRILRPIWRDPRLHYAVNCASLGCPNLLRVAYTAVNAESLLDEGARAYVNHPRGVTFAADRLHVSSLYVWYQADFGGSDAGAIAHLKAYAQPTLSSLLARVERIDTHSYDWTLNDAR